jgi:hypothetical protein
VTLLPIATVRAHVLHELDGARAWANRCGHDLAFDEDALSLKLALVGPATSAETNERYLLTASFEDYRALPPSWRFVHPNTSEDIGAAAYPASLTPSLRGSNLFIAGGPSGAVICAHFNRLAYVENQNTPEQTHGVHADWGEPTEWLNLPATEYTHAETIGDMLARIALEVSDSPGRMAPLPS